MAIKANEKMPACKLSTIINSQFITVQLIGKGSYGVVYEVVRLDSPTTRFACKAELAAVHHNLKTEWELMTLLKDNKANHCIPGVVLSAERNFNYIIMHLVGPSLAELRSSMPKKKFSLYTTTVCAIQCFDSLVEIQNLGYIHRDVKPSNFAIGVLGTDEEKLVYVLDFGLCRNLFKNKQLRKPRMKAPFRGTVPYCSVNIHLRMEAGRHDDLWSLLYMMIEFHLGNLPWENMSKEDTKKAKEKKMDGLLKKCPTEFQMIRSHLLTLCYSREPDYARLRLVLCQIMQVNKFTPEMPLDWQIGGECESVFKRRAEIVRHKGSKRKINLAELLNLPKFGEKLLTDSDFTSSGEGEPRDDSVSKSDDTIIDKDCPIPIAFPIPKPVKKQKILVSRSKESHRAVKPKVPQTQRTTHAAAPKVPSPGTLAPSVPAPVAQKPPTKAPSPAPVVPTSPKASTPTKNVVPDPKAVTSKETARKLSQVPPLAVATPPASAAPPKAGNSKEPSKDSIRKPAVCHPRAVKNAANSKEKSKESIRKPAAARGQPTPTAPATEIPQKTTKTNEPVMDSARKISAAPTKAPSPKNMAASKATNSKESVRKAATARPQPSSTPPVTAASPRTKATRRANSKEALKDSAGKRAAVSPQPTANPLTTTAPPKASTPKKHKKTSTSNERSKESEGNPAAAPPRAHTPRKNTRRNSKEHSRESDRKQTTPKQSKMPLPVERSPSARKAAPPAAKQITPTKA